MKTHPVLLFLTPLIALTFLSSTSLADTTYTVRRGDTLLKIADRSLGIVNDTKDPRRYELAKQIRALNPQLKDANNLNPGDTLTIPDAAATKPARSAKPSTKPVPAVKPPIHAHGHAGHAAPPAAGEEVLPPPPPLEEEAADVHSKPAPAAPPAHVTHEPPPPPEKVAPAPVPPPRSTPPPPPGHGELHAKEKNYDYIAIQPRLHNVDIKFHDENAEAKVKSKLAAGLDFTYGKAMGERGRFLFSLGFTQVQFGDITPDTATMDPKSLSQKNLAVGYAYELLPSLHMDFLAKAAERTFLVPAGGEVYATKSILLPGAEVSLAWHFIHAHSYNVGAALIAEYLSEVTKDDVKYKAHLAPLASIFWDSNYGRDQINYRASLLYDKRDQHMSTFEQLEVSWIAGLTMYFPL